MVRLISMAMTGYYRTMQRPRVHQPLSMLKYDPIGMIPLCFVAVGVKILVEIRKVGGEEKERYEKGRMQ